MASPFIADSDFRFMGDILDASFSFFTAQLSSLTLLLLQLKPVPVELDNAITAWKLLAKVFGVGMVGAVMHEQATFSVTLTQYVTGGQNEGVKLCAVMEKSPKWLDPCVRLPALNGMVVFTGNLSHFDKDEHNNDVTSHALAVICLDSITYLPWFGVVSSSSSNDVGLSADSTDNAKVKQSMQKFSTKDNSLKGNLVSASTVAKQKGKCKVSPLDIMEISTGTVDDG